MSDTQPFQSTEVKPELRSAVQSLSDQMAAPQPSESNQAEPLEPQAENLASVSIAEPNTDTRTERDAMLKHGMGLSSHHADAAVHISNGDIDPSIREQTANGSLQHPTDSYGLEQLASKLSREEQNLLQQPQTQSHSHPPSEPQSQSSIHIQPPISASIIPSASSELMDTTMEDIGQPAKTSDQAGHPAAKDFEHQQQQPLPTQQQQQQQQTPPPSSSSQPHPHPHPSDLAASTPPSASSSPNKSASIILMASRKQNSACDACRSRKVRCNREPGQSKCNHCKAKSIDCTTHYVQWATSSAKRPSKRPRTSLNAVAAVAAAAAVAVAVDEPQDVAEPVVKEAAVEAQNRLMNYLFQRDAGFPPETAPILYHSNMPYTSPSTSAGAAARIMYSAAASSASKPAATTTAELRLLDRATRDDFVNDLVETYFSVVHVRIPILNPHVFKKRHYERSADIGGPPPDVLLALVLAYGAKFTENPLVQTDREESSKELQKALNSAQGAMSRGETERAEQITGFKGGVDQPILTVSPDLRANGRNRLAEDLAARAQEVLDRVKAHRVASVENIQACLLAELLLSQPSILFSDNLSLSGRPTVSNNRPSSAFAHGFWYQSAVKHLLDLGINQRETVAVIKDPGVRTELVFAWWMASTSDASSSVYYRRKPLLSAQDYNCDLPAEADHKKDGPDALLGLDSHTSYYGSLSDMAVIHRELADLFWRPVHPLQGIEIDQLECVSRLIEEWRDRYIEKVGVPTPSWPAHWDYIAAVSACCSDISYHALWILLWQVIDEFGIRGTDRNNATSSIVQDYLQRQHLDPSAQSTHGAEPPLTDRAVTFQAKIEQEALNSALRIAGLTDVLRTNCYLRLDPAIFMPPLELAAVVFIRFQRSEIDIVVKGFRQYGMSYEDCYDKADAMERLAAAYQERGRVDPTFIPGSALGLTLARDAMEAQHNGIPGLAIAAAAISNAAVSVTGHHDNGPTDQHDTYAKDVVHPPAPAEQLQFHPTHVVDTASDQQPIQDSTMETVRSDTPPVAAVDDHSALSVLGNVAQTEPQQQEHQPIPEKEQQQQHEPSPSQPEQHQQQQQQSPQTLSL